MAIRKQRMLKAADCPGFAGLSLRVAYKNQNNKKGGYVFTFGKIIEELPHYFRA